MGNEGMIRKAVAGARPQSHEPLSGVPAARTLGETVRRIRRKRDWSIEDLAERADMSYQYLSEIETGKRNFSIMVLERLAHALDVTLVGLVDAAYRQAGPAESSQGQSPVGRMPPMPATA